MSGIFGNLRYRLDKSNASQKGFELDGPTDLGPAHLPAGAAPEETGELGWGKFSRIVHGGNDSIGDGGLTRSFPSMKMAA